MVSKEHRFHGLSSLRFVYGRGSVVRGGFYSIKFSPNKRQASYRLAVVVSKKVSKSAVVRNKIRRRIFETIKLYEGRIQQPYDIVITVYSTKVAEMPFSELRESLEKQLKATKII